MAYEHERDEWRSAVRAMTETDRILAGDQTRRALGVVGDRDDAAAETHLDSGDDD